VNSPCTTVSAFAPATIANVGSAFDVLGCALTNPGDTVVATLTQSHYVSISAVHGDSGRLSCDPRENTAGVSVQYLLDSLVRRFPGRYDNVGISLELHKGLPIGSGLGSSSASTVAAVVAAHELLGSPLSRLELLPFAMEGERVACGAAHADNVAPCLLGGFVLIRSYDPLDVIQLPSPSPLVFAVASPHLELKTSDARKVLRRSIPLTSAVTQWGNVAALVAGLYRNDLDLIGRALHDTIIEPERAQLIPGYREAKEAALSSGAVGCAISGSGPAVFAVCRSEAAAEQVVAAMREAFAHAGVATTTHISPVNVTGAHVLTRK
jgi:homoserine kinase